jgi:hypothetical protein
VPGRTAPPPTAAGASGLLLSVLGETGAIERSVEVGSATGVALGPGPVTCGDVGAAMLPPAAFTMSGETPRVARVGLTGACVLTVACCRACGETCRAAAWTGCEFVIVFALTTVAALAFWKLFMVVLLMLLMVTLLMLVTFVTFVTLTLRT